MIGVGRSQRKVGHRTGIAAVPAGLCNPLCRLMFTRMLWATFRRYPGLARVTPLAGVSLIMLVGALEAQAGRADSAAPVRAMRVDGGLRLDGIPDEPQWLLADSITDFRQRDPDEGQPASERTVVRVLAAPAGLYIAFWNSENHARAIRRTQLRRDADFQADDHVSVMIDAQRDARSGYVFSVNPNGALYDAEIVSHEELNQNWNGVWDARAQRTAFGWTAELFIPWQNLRYPTVARSFGFNAVRFIRHSNQEVLWRAWRRQQGILFQQAEGVLEVPGPLPSRRVFEGRPYLATEFRLASREIDSSGALVVTDAAGSSVKPGFDGKIAVAPTVTLDLTANTDFAQVDADRQVVNLSRFPVFFPEQRQFFLESSAIFSLGQAGRTQLFNSRRIGLDTGGNVVPILGGARLTGRLGRERFGLLALRTGAGENAVDLVARIQRDAFARGYVGAMGTWQGGPGVAGDRLGGGLDFAFPLLLTGQNIIPQGFVAFTRNASGAPPATAWRFFLDYPNDWANHFIAISRIEAGFDPALGFVRQSGVQRQTAALEFFPRPHRWGVRRLNLKAIEFDISENLDGSLNNGFYEVRPLGADFESGDSFEFNLQHSDDVPADSFEIFPGRLVGAGRYGWNRAELAFQSSAARPVGLSASVSTGGLYNGTAQSLEYVLDVRLAPHLGVAMDGAWSWVDFATGRFTARVHRLRVDYATSPRLSTTLFVQWDNESRRLAANARLHWIPAPGSDAYLVWNTAWPTEVRGRGGIPFRRPLNGALIGKFVYYFRR